MENKKYPPGKHPNSRKALKEHGFKSGQSGNPKGRPKGIKYLSEALNKGLKDAVVVNKIAQRIIQDAQAGNYNAIGMIFERTEGKVPLGLTGQGEITIRVVYENDRSQAQESREA